MFVIEMQNHAIPIPLVWIIVFSFQKMRLNETGVKDIDSSARLVEKLWFFTATTFNGFSMEFITTMLPIALQDVSFVMQSKTYTWNKKYVLNFLHWNIYLDIVYENISPLRMCNEAKFICANKNSANIFQEKIFLWNVCRFLLWYVFYRNSHDDLYNAFMIFSWNLVLPISFMLFLTSDSIHINILF